MKKFTQITENTTRESLIEVLKVIDGVNFQEATYKGKRANTLSGVISEKLASDPKLAGSLNKKFSFIEIEKDDVVAETTPAETPKKLRIVDMTDAQIIESLTPKQKDVLETIVEKYDVNADKIMSHAFMTSDKSSWSIGGVVTTLIEKGVLSRDGKGISKSFSITERFAHLIEKKCW